MRTKQSYINIFKIAGAYIAYVIGSGFATGQEIVQFFTVYGEGGIAGMVLCTFLFAWIGAVLLKDGFRHRTEKQHRKKMQEKKESNNDSRVYEFYCGRRIGGLFEIFVPLTLFCTVVVMLAGAGAAMAEYYGIDYRLGCFLMAALVFLSYILGFHRLVNAIGCLAPLIIFFMIAVGILTLSNADLSRIVVLFETKKAADAEYGLWWVSALLYVSYNTVAAVPFFHALGASAGSSRQAAAGGIFGAFFLMTAAFFMNLAILIGTESADNLAIPTLYLARQISPLFGAAFSFVLLIEIFSTAAPMMWTFCSRFAKDGSKKAVAIGLFFIIPAYLFSALPFERLVGCIYPASGVFGFVFLACLIKTFFLRCRRKKSTDGGCREKWGSGCDRKIRMIK